MTKALGAWQKAMCSSLPDLIAWLDQPRDLLNVLAVIAERRAGLRSLGDAWADITTPHGCLMLTVLGGLAELERELIRARTGEGRARAVKNGVKLGRKPKLTPHQIREVIERRQIHGESLTGIARSFNVNHTTTMRIVAAAEISRQ